MKDHWLSRIKRLTGMDRAIAYTVTARTAQIIGSAGTVLLIVRFLSPVEQGYYYTLLSLLALQTVFELGFSFVVLQLAAHESVHLKLFRDGRIEGDPVAHDRLASVLQLTVRWYLRAAVTFAAVLLPLGVIFFSQKVQAGAPVAWLGPWITAVLATSLSFLLTPLYSFLEGCNEIQQVARVRIHQALIVLGLSWGAIATGHGLYACALVNLGVTSVGVVFLARRRGLLLGLLRHPVNDGGISWRNEVWPFQWKIAVSWLCSYFMMQIFTPILFAYRGPTEAGRMGLSLSIVGYLPIVVLSWITTKATPFGQLVKLGRFQELDTIFFRTLRQSLLMVMILAAACLAAVIGVQHVVPKIAARMETPSIFVLLLFTATSSFVVQSMAIYLRSFKQEPYLVQSVVVAGLTVLSVLLTAARWGSAGVAIIYFSFSGVLGLLWAIAIFHGQRTVRIRERFRNPVLPTGMRTEN